MGLSYPPLYLPLKKGENIHFGHRLKVQSKS